MKDSKKFLPTTKTGFSYLGNPFDESFDWNFQHEIISDAPSENVQNYLLATSNFGKSMQDDINMYVTRGRLNNAILGQKLNPTAKNIFRRQKPLELVFKDISNFDAQNPIIGSLLKEIDFGKKNIASTLIKKHQILMISRFNQGLIL